MIIILHSGLSNEHYAYYEYIIENYKLKRGEFVHLSRSWKLFQLKHLQFYMRKILQYLWTSFSPFAYSKMSETMGIFAFTTWSVFMYYDVIHCVRCRLREFSRMQGLDYSNHTHQEGDEIKEKGEWLNCPLPL